VTASRSRREYECRPITTANLVDLDRFSSQHGKFRWCSCMRWRMTSSQYRASTKESRVATLEDLVRQGQPVGVLAYEDSHPVGCCSIAPRGAYGALERFRALPRIDDEAVWAVVCFFVDRLRRGQRLTLALLLAAVDYAHAQGARVVEGYPVRPDGGLYTYMGSPSTFKAAGFSDVTPPGSARLVMRHLGQP
jgi:GNAT superfamily N-acetyltransferase